MPESLPMRMNVRRLLSWYRRTARDLPWRRTKDPYAVWVSEIMLQQTQIATVIPYYERWMKRFPTAKALAAASLDEVLKLWEGLGYYARARNLHRAAREMSDWPRTSEEWREVRGVGAYTAAAIASIAHGECVAVFDGNVRRVLSRLAGRDVMEAPPPPARSAGDYNQALMELGQRICRPRNPDCAVCPLVEGCRSRERGETDLWPTRPPKKALPHYEVAVGLIWKGSRLFVQRRKEEGFLGGLWEFPGGKRKSGESYETCLAREIREETGMRVRVGDFLVRVPHRYSHFSVELHAYHCEHIDGTAPGRWVIPSGLRRLAIPTANLRILEALLAEHRRSGAASSRSRC